MKSYIIILVCLASLAIGIGCGNKSSDSPANGGTSVAWVSTSVLYDTTITKKDYSMIYFRASWCGWSAQMEQTTLVDPQVVNILNTYYNCVKIDIDTDTLVTYFNNSITCGQYANNYGVSSVPQTHFLDFNGTWLGVIEGYRTPSEYASLLNSIRAGSLGK